LIGFGFDKTRPLNQSAKSFAAGFYRPAHHPTELQLPEFATGTSKAKSS
jgi:hypothetical protein